MHIFSTSEYYKENHVIIPELSSYCKLSIKMPPQRRIASSLRVGVCNQTRIA